MESDYELLTSWGEGSSVAGNALFQRHFTSVYRFFVNKCGPSTDAAQDLVQQTFLACVEGRDRFRRDASFRTYLFQTARFILYGHYRALKRRNDLDFTSHSAADMGIGITTQLARREQEQLLLAGLRRLPVDMQVALELSYWEELPESEIAEILQVPRGTVSSRLRRARAQLREWLANTDNAAVSRRTLDDLDSWARALRDQLA